MDIKTAIETAKKIKRCKQTGGYYCSLTGCFNCENSFEAKEEMQMLEAFIELEEKQNRNTINLTLEFDEEKIKRYLTEADIVEVVRCADCLHRTGVTCWKKNILIKADGFCEEGKKGINENN